MKIQLQIMKQKIGNIGYSGSVVLKGMCPFCLNAVTFRQIGEEVYSKFLNRNVAVRCEGCHSHSIFSINQNKLYPSPKMEGLSELPSEIQKYYDEALRCISADCPNGATTLFRKIIHALGIHYKLAKKNDNKKLYEIIKGLHKEEHIVKKLEKALLGVKDIGNDGAHVNENEPDIDQALKIKHLIDTVLNSTVITDSKLKEVKKAHIEKDVE